MNGACWVSFVIAAVTESTKIVFAENIFCSFSHFGWIEARDMPETERGQVVGGSCPAVPDKVLVNFVFRAVAGMKRRWDSFGGADQYILGKIKI